MDNRSLVLLDVCPKCGARLVTRNLWHSCGRFTLEARFAGLYPRKNGFRAAFALRRWLKSPRIAKRADYGPRWRGHFVDIRSATDLDDELRAWLREAHDTVGIQSDIGSAKPRR